MSGSHAHDRALLNSLLKRVSRSFYLTLRVLPRSIRPQIGLAYLLARTSDTIADTEIIPVEQRLQMLAAFGRRIKGEDTDPLDFSQFARDEAASPAEHELLENCETSLSLLESLPGGDRPLVRGVLDTIISGQDLDLRRF